LKTKFKFKFKPRREEERKQKNKKKKNKKLTWADCFISGPWCIILLRGPVSTAVRALDQMLRGAHWPAFPPPRASHHRAGHLRQISPLPRVLTGPLLVDRSLRCLRAHWRVGPVEQNELLVVPVLRPSRSSSRVNRARWGRIDSRIRTPGCLPDSQCTVIGSSRHHRREKREQRWGSDVARVSLSRRR
jgi:hypothetical protein